MGTKLKLAPGSEVINETFYKHPENINEYIAKDITTITICNACTIMSTKSKLTCPYRQGLYGGCVKIEAIKKIGEKDE